MLLNEGNYEIPENCHIAMHKGYHSFSIVRNLSVAAFHCRDCKWFSEEKHSLAVHYKQYTCLKHPKVVYGTTGKYYYSANPSGRICSDFDEKTNN